MIFDDKKTNVVYIAECMSLRYPDVFKASVLNLRSNGIEVRLVKKTFNIWCRDYMPVQVGKHFVKFGYKGYGEGYGAFPWLQVAEQCFSDLKPIKKCPLVLDGGGIVTNGTGTAVMTNIVFKHNPALSHKSIVDTLLKTLECKKIVFVPVEPEDSLGHADGILKFINEDTVLVNDYSGSDPTGLHGEYGKELYATLASAGLKIKKMPYAFNLCPWPSETKFRKEFPFADDFNPGFGYYINFLLCKNVILLPVFGIPKDVEAMATVKRCYPSHNVISIDCSKLSMEGGLCNCTTMNYTL